MINVRISVEQFRETLDNHLMTPRFGNFEYFHGINHSTGSEQNLWKRVNSMSEHLFILNNLDFIYWMHKKKFSFNTISLITVIHYVIYCESWNSDLISVNKKKSIWCDDFSSPLVFLQKTLIRKFEMKIMPFHKLPLIRKDAFWLIIWLIDFFSLLFRFLRFFLGKW